MKKIQPAGLDELFDALRRRGFTLVGPTVRDRAVVYDEIESPAALPAGWVDEQNGGSYRLRRNGGGVFDTVLGPQSWKKFFLPPREQIWGARRTRDGFEVNPPGEREKKYALIGVRACELAAMSIQDRVFASEAFEGGRYRTRREDAFIVAVNCGRAAPTCFCTSMNTGPRVRNGFDLALTEIRDDRRHFFTVETGSDYGEEVMGDVAHLQAEPADEEAASDVVARAMEQITRTLDTDGLPEFLLGHLNHPHWETIAGRCLACGNCTQVCPTCFCSTTEDTTDLDGDGARRWRRWDSCFTLDFSYIHGGNIRSSTSARYRQWMTHKLAGWVEQFGTMGCVGCGRCITWCPVGIDITQEVRAMRETAPAGTAP